MTHLSTYFIIFILFFTFSAKAHPVCQKITLPDQGQACFYRGEGILSNYLLYYFHGILGDQTSWEKKEIPEKLRKRWEELGLGVPHVISITFGKYWLATPFASPIFQGKLSDLTPFELLKLESKLPIHSIQSRWILGDSMGGHNAWQLALRFPHYFKRVATLCSAQIGISPFAPALERLSYAHDSNGDPLWVLAGSLLFRSFYLTPKIWEKESPLTLLKGFSPPQDASYGIMTVQNDKYGFTLPNYEMYEILLSKTSQVQYWEVPGEHCHPSEIEPIADFFYANN